jgi:hypothetical protein
MLRLLRVRIDTLPDHANGTGKERQVTDFVPETDP